jgi:hypothetical protein
MENGVIPTLIRQAQSSQQIGKSGIAAETLERGNALE